MGRWGEGRARRATQKCTRVKWFICHHRHIVPPYAKPAHVTKLSQSIIVIHQNRQCNVPLIGFVFLFSLFCRGRGGSRQRKLDSTPSAESKPPAKKECTTHTPSLPAVAAASPTDTPAERAARPSPRPCPPLNPPAGHGTRRTSAGRRS